MSVPGPPGPAGPPPWGGGYPTPPRRPPPPTRRALQRPAVLVGLVFALVVGGAAVGIGLLLFTGRAVAADVLTEPVNTAGTNPFSPPVGMDRTGITPVADSGGRFDPATTPGLYGGTRDSRTCDPDAMVEFLAAEPAKAAAWAGVLGVTPAAIPSYVAELTPVLLRSDTYVTNHGYRDGQATTLTSVLQAGTAVLVDRYGTPRVKCFCGNPLTPAVVPSTPRYVGPAWPGFSSTRVTIINVTTTVINDYTLVDPTTGQGFVRPAGSRGDDDRDTAGLTAPGTIPTRPPTVSTVPATRPPTISTVPATRPPRTSTVAATRPPSTSRPRPSQPPTSGPSGGSGSLSWSTTAVGHRGAPTGQRLRFVCPPNGQPATVWGTDLYTDDSSICTAGVHAGVISFAAGGPVTIATQPGGSSYSGSVRNGVTTLDWTTPWPQSFTVAGS